VNQTLSQSVPPNVILAIKSAAKMYAGEIIEGARRVQTEWVEAGEEQISNPPPPGVVPRVPEDRRAPLMPDHLREAHRRYVLEGDGGLVGQLGLWQQQQHSGVERFAVKAGGKRLFK
jgi:transcription initiation factor TFIID subunit 11